MTDIEEEEVNTDLDSETIQGPQIISVKEFEKIKSGLIKIGYYHNGNQGIEKREVFKRNGKSFYGNP